MKNALIIIFTCLFITSGVGWFCAERHLFSLKSITVQQQQVIDSLLNLQPSLEVHLAVTDRSTLKVNAAKNSGSVIVPSEKHYVVEIDSVSIKNWQ